MAIYQAPPCPNSGDMPPTTCVETPVIQAYSRGAITSYDVIDETNEHYRFGILQEFLECAADVLPMPDGICPPDAFVKVPTYGDESTYVQGCSWSLYSAIDCRRTNLSNMQAEVERIFALGEQRAVEAAVWTNTIANPAAIVLNASSLPADAFSPVQALAALESAMAASYPGRATFHADRGLATYFAAEACCLVQPAGDGLVTNLGSRWAFYAGSPNTGPDGVAAPAGYAWIYGTGQLQLRRFAPIVNIPDFPLQKTPTGGQTNVPYAMTERSYLSTVPCVRYAALICLGC